MNDPVTASPAKPVWRVGRAPDPWAWPDPEYAYGQRWDDVGRAFRTIYAGDSALACFVEVLAHARPGLTGDPDYDGIDVDAEDQATFRTPPPGTVDPVWLTSKLLTSAVLDGTFCDVTQSDTIQALRPALLRTALEAGFSDLDSAALKTAGANGRRLTQATATFLYNAVSATAGPAFDGIYFTSRHGDEFGLWAVFERAGETPTSRLVTPTETAPVTPDSVDIEQAFALLNLTWPTD